MKYTLAFVLLLAGALVGCSNDNGVAPLPQTDQQALQQHVTTIDSVAQFSTSDEATIDDNGLKDPNYDGLAKEAALSIGHLNGVSSDSLQPIRWGRHINWSQVVRTYEVIMLGDTGAVVKMTKTIPGQFFVAFGHHIIDSIVIDTIVQKPFTEVVKRNVLFRRIAHSANRLLNWLPVAITLVQGKTDLPGQFAIVSLEISDPAQSYDTTITSPLETWFRLGLFRGSVPRFTAGDSLDVKVTVTSSDDSSEVVTLRHSVLGAGFVNRSLMRLTSTTGSPGNYTRVYEKRFRARLPLLVLGARFNAIVDVLSHGSVYSLSDPFTNEYWGFPYIVVR